MPGARLLSLAARSPALPQRALPLRQQPSSPWTGTSPSEAAHFRARIRIAARTRARAGHGTEPKEPRGLDSCNALS